MPGYLLIESRDPFESTGAARTYELAIQLRAAGHDVALFLVQNGVLAVRGGARRTRSRQGDPGRRSKCWRTTSRCASAASRHQPDRRRAGDTDRLGRRTDERRWNAALALGLS